MNRQVVYGLTLFTICLVIDQFSKNWGLSQGISVENHGFIFGLADDFPLTLRILGLVSIFGFLFFFYLLLLLFLPAQLNTLKYGLSLLSGGIFGNVADRIWRGSSIDFIPFGLGEYSVTFNIADVFQWIGAGLILFNVIVHEKIIWYPENKRGRVLIHPKEQVLFSFKMVGSVLIAAFLLGLFSLSFLKNIGDIPTATVNFFLLSYLSLTLLFSLAIFITGLFLSHKIAGPFYAFELYIEEILQGRDTPLVLREGDHYQHLITVAEQVRLIIKKGRSS